jgi:predicted ATPase
MLQYVARRIAQSRVLVVGTYRDTDLGRMHPLGRVLAALRKDAPYERLQLRGLSGEDVSALLTAVEAATGSERGRERLAAALYNQSEGNPLFIREILSHLVEEGRVFRDGGAWKSNVTDVLDLGMSEGLREVIGLRLSRLSRECNELLGVASLMLGQFTWAELCSVHDIPDASMVGLLEEALDAQLIVERKSGRLPVYEREHAA